MDFSALQGQAQTQPGIDSGMDVKKTKLTRIFGIISAVFIGLSLAIVLSGLFSYLYYFEGYFDSEYNTELYDATAAALLFGFVALGTGITTFVLGLKQKNVGVRYVSTVIFIASIFAVFIPLVCS
jgi:hypothetical protein